MILPRQTFSFAEARSGRWTEFSPNARAAQRSGSATLASAFTLIEMLVVLVVIGIFAAMTLPALKGFGQSNVMAAANRQLLDDISYARQLAMNHRADVYVIFVPPEIVGSGIFASLNTPEEKKLATNLLGGIYTTYALFSKRRAGEQPGQENPRYLTSWKSLPDGVFIDTNKFTAITSTDPITRPFQRMDPFPFPVADGPDAKVYGFAFNSRGQLKDPVSGAVALDEIVIPLVRGSIFYARDRNGNLLSEVPDVQETPPGNGVNNFNHIIIDPMTGRARVERPQIQ